MIDCMHPQCSPLTAHCLRSVQTANDTLKRAKGQIFQLAKTVGRCSPPIVTPFALARVRSRVPWVLRWKSPCSPSWAAKNDGGRARESCSSEVRPSPRVSRARHVRSRIAPPDASCSLPTTRSSRSREHADHCDLRSTPEVVKLLAKHGEPPLVLFSEEVLKINRRGEAVPRIMLVATNAVYLLDAETRRVRRKIAVKALGCLRMSEHSDNFLALVYPEEYDVLLVCARKIEAVLAMCDAYGASVGTSGETLSDDGQKKTSKTRKKRLAVELSTSFTYAAGADLTKQVTFVRLEDGEVDTTIRDVV